MNENTKKYMEASLENFLDFQSRLEALFPPGFHEINYRIISQEMSAIIEYLKDDCKENIDKIICDYIQSLENMIVSFINTYIIPMTLKGVLSIEDFLKFRQLETIYTVGAINFRLYKDSKEGR